MRSFDEEYNESEELYGHPYQELQDYFKKHPKGKVLDLGCGQGRDSLFLASSGFQVTAVDSSKIGISQMLEKNNNINGVVADIEKYEPEESFDVILFDMILHSFEDKQRSELLKKFSKNLREEGIVCIVFPDDMTTESFMDQLNSFGSWKLIEEIIVKDTPKIPGDDGDYTFVMAIFRKSK